jgi:hypothetical protein
MAIAKYQRPRNMKKTSIGVKPGRIKWASMNKNRKRNFKPSRGQGR